jgi:hypothetical protein
LRGSDYDIAIEISMIEATSQIQRARFACLSVVLCRGAEFMMWLEGVGEFIPQLAFHGVARGNSLGSAA